jgi:hypothetical protein
MTEKSTPRTDELARELMRYGEGNPGKVIDWLRHAQLLERELAEERETSRMMLETVEYWQGHGCGGDCLAAPCTNCDGAGYIEGHGQRLKRELAEARDTLSDANALGAAKVEALCQMQEAGHALREYAGALRAAAERMVLTFRDWMAGCANETRWKDVEAAHINLRDALAQSGHEIVHQRGGESRSASSAENMGHRPPSAPPHSENAVGTGFVTVPVEPTHEMLYAAGVMPDCYELEAEASARRGEPPYVYVARTIYKKMIEAANPVLSQYSPPDADEAQYLVAYGGDGADSRVVAESKLLDAYLEICAGDDPRQRAECAAHLADEDQWETADNAERSRYRFRQDFEDGWLEITRIFEHPYARAKLGHAQVRLDEPKA